MQFSEGKEKQEQNKEGAKEILWLIQPFTIIIIKKICCGARWKKLINKIAVKKTKVKRWKRGVWLTVTAFHLVCHNISDPKYLNIT